MAMLCPNHQVPCQYSGTPRIYICPVSTAEFEFDDQTSSSDVKLDKFGNILKQYKITPQDDKEDQ